MNPARRRYRALAAGLGLVAALPGVSLDIAAAQGASAASPMRVLDAWTRPVPKVVMSNEFYMTLVNTGTRVERLLTASSEACGMVMLFESYRGERGMVGMRPVRSGSIEVPPGRVELRPDGIHLMCMDRKWDFQPGRRVPVTLRFEPSGEVRADVEIRE